MNQEQLAQIRYDCVLPAAIFFNKNLCPACIKLYAMVRNLTKVHGYCFATNSYLSKLLETDKRTIQRQLASLKDEGYLEIFMGKIGEKSQRKIYLSDEFQKIFTGDKNVMGGVTKMSPIKEKNINKYSSSSTASPSLSRSEPLPVAHSNSEPPSPEALKLAKLFSSSLIKFNPKALIDERETAEVFASMQKQIQSVGVEEMCASIKFLFEMEDSYWRKGVHDAKAFQKALPSILKQMLQSQAAQKYENTKKINRSVAKQVVKHFKMQSKSNQYLDEDQAFARKILSRFVLEKDCVFDKESGQKIKFCQSEQEFLRLLSSIFEIQFQE